MTVWKPGLGGAYGREISVATLHDHVLWARFQKRICEAVLLVPALSAF